MDEDAGAFTQATGRSLEAGAGQPRYRRYQLALIAPHCGRSVLEVGAGLGEFASQLTGRERIVLTDVDPAAVRVMRERFADRAEVQVRQLDIGGDPPPDEPVESAVAINVLEHLRDDVAALRWLAGLVAPGGSLVLWVPAYQALYGDFDRKVGHFRRYTPASLRSVVQAAGLRVQLCQPANLLGGLAWWLAVRVGGCGSPRPRLVAVYDRLVVPLTSALERRVRVPFGQSVLCVARTRVPEPNR